MATGVDSRKRAADQVLETDEGADIHDQTSDFKVKRHRSADSDEIEMNDARNGYESPAPLLTETEEYVHQGKHNNVHSSELYPCTTPTASSNRESHGYGDEDEMKLEDGKTSNPLPFGPSDTPSSGGPVQSTNSSSRPSPAAISRQGSRQGEDAFIPTVGDALTREQLKFCGNVLRSLKRLKDARPFLIPVDPVALNIPTYSDIVKTPMDLSTAENKLRTNQYSSAQEFVDDIQLMIDNCYAFNGREAPVGQNGVNLERSFHKYMEKLPTEIKPEKNKKRLSTADSMVGIHVEGGGAATSEAGRPKREIHAPLKDIPIVTSTPSTKHPLSKTKLADRDMKFCLEVLRELHKKQHAAYNFPFLQPVDPIALGIPHYTDIIKNPMDLSTIRRKLDAGDYHTAEEFEADARLMFNNCYTFNPPGTDVYNFGKKLEEVFERKWRERPHGGSPAPPRSQRASKAKIKAQAVADEYSSSDDDDEDALQLKLLQQQLQAITTQMAWLQEKRAKKKQKRKSMATTTQTPSSASKVSKAPKSKTKSANPGATSRRTSSKKSGEKAKPRRRVEYSSDDGENGEKLPELTYEQKTELSELVAELPPERIDKVMEIIRSGSALPDTMDQGEIELDIEVLSKSTLWRLYNYVKGHSGRGVASHRAHKPPKSGKPNSKSKGPVGLSRATDSSSNESDSGSGSVDSGDDSN
ncbi:hypothetical protein SpCBS45565_g02837 [Spizellomyces sp. 'palustris']|nr:hypothetical protein SpCBS45565_g02837 [Spizellomyces sp. 'palustris']